MKVTKKEVVEKLRELSPLSKGQKGVRR